MIKAQERYQAGLDHYGANRYEEALKEFEAAWALKPIPKVLVSIAQAHLALDNKGKALEYFQKFLYHSRVKDPERAAIEEQVQKLLDAAPATGPEDEKELPQPKPMPDDRVDRTRKEEAGPAAILHSPVHEGHVGKAIAIAAEIPRGIEAAVVAVHFRNAGEPTFERLPLEAQGNALVAAIPGRRVTSTAIQYYLEAYDEGGSLVAISGTDTSPHLVAIGGGKVFTKAKEAPKVVSKYRKWTWGSAITAATLFTAAAVTGLLARDRQNALDDSEKESIRLGSEPGREPALFGDNLRSLESEGEAFEAISVMSFLLGTASTLATGTFIYLEHAETEKPAPTATAGRRAGWGAWSR